MIFHTLQPSTTNGGGALLISRRPPSERASLPHTVRAVVQGPADSPPSGGREMGGGAGGGGCRPPPARAEHREGGGARSLPRGGALSGTQKALCTVAYARPHAHPFSQAARTAVTHTTARSRTPHRSCQMHTTPFAPAVVTLDHVTAPRPSPPALLALPFSPCTFRHLCAGQSPPATCVAFLLFNFRADAAWRAAAASVLVTAAVRFLCVSRIIYIITHTPFPPVVRW